MKSLSQTINEALTHAADKAKPFKSAKIGDIAYTVSDDNKIGKIVYLGRTDDIRTSKYADLLTKSHNQSSNYAWAVVNNGKNNMLYNYDEDESGITTY